MSEKEKVFGALFRRDFGSGPHDFRKTLSEIAVSALGKTQADADHFADLNLTRYWNWFLQEVDSFSRRGLLPYFRTHPGGMLFMDYCAESVTAVDSKLREKGSLGQARPAILRALDAVSDREYEAISGEVCKHIGLRDPQHYVLTPPGNEGGIDFVAAVEVPSSCHLFSGAGRELRIVGQCKKYSSKVQVDRVETFLQTMQNVRHRAARVAKHLPAWFDSSQGPILGWIIGHSGFQSGCHDEARNHGVIISDSIDLANILALGKQFHRHLGCAARANKVQSACCDVLMRFP